MNTKKLMFNDLIYKSMTQYLARENIKYLVSFKLTKQKLTFKLYKKVFYFIF